MTREVRYLSFEQQGPGTDPAWVVLHVKPSYSLHLRYEVFDVCILSVVDDTESAECVFFAINKGTFDSFPL